jgi:hypothetical protein
MAADTARTDQVWTDPATPRDQAVAGSPVPEAASASAALNWQARAEGTAAGNRAGRAKADTAKAGSVADRAEEAVEVLQEDPRKQAGRTVHMH